MSECTERCEEQFGQCIRHGDNMGGSACIAHRSACLYGCRDEYFPDPSPPVAQEMCGQGPCPECGEQYSMSSACTLPGGHADYHACSYAHSW
jgi:hypothetical protein